MEDRLAAFLSTGNGYGSGSGYGSSLRYFYGNGSGYGYGNGSGLHSIAGQRVYLIDGVPTIIERVYHGYACGYIVKSVADLEPCYIVNYYGHFAHGETLGEALRDARAKYEQSMPVKMRIEFFMTLYPDIDKPYPARKLFASHGTLTGSCEQGRKAFCETHGLDMDKEYTVREFIDICRDAYRGEVIRQLEQTYTIPGNESKRPY